MKEYKLKTGKMAEKVTGAYKNVEDTFVNGYKNIENAAVGSYKKIEKKFVEAFLEEAESNEDK